jgi:hypothetical protein
MDAGNVLATALAETRDALSGRAARSNGGELELIDGLLASGPRGDAVAWLAAAAGRDGERREVLGDVLGAVARRLAHTGEAPTERTAAEAWQVLATALDRLFGSGVRALGRLPFVGDALLELLVAEARRQLPEPGENARRPRPGAPGPALASLAASRKLRDAVSNAFGFAVAPTLGAVYLSDPPGSHVRTHVDTRDYELVLHLVLEHALPEDGSGGSALLVHLPGRPAPLRLPVAAGEAVALLGRGTIHSWERLRDDEHRILVAVGFTRE